MQNGEILVATEYFRQREAELGENWRINHLDNLVLGGRLVWGLRAIFQHDTEFGVQYYQSVYVFEQYRGKGLMSDFVKQAKLPFITMTECGIDKWFVRRKIPVLVVG